MTAESIMIINDFDVILSEGENYMVEFKESTDNKVTFKRNDSDNSSSRFAYIEGSSETIIEKI